MPPSATAVRSQATELIGRYRADMSTYSADCLCIVTKSARLEKLTFNRAQQIVHEKVSAQLRETGSIKAIVLKARQEGVSTYVAARGMRRASLYANQNCMVIADQRKRGSVLFNIYETFHRYLPDHARPTKRYASKSTQLWYDTPSGVGGLNSKIQVETAKDAAAGRASTIHFLHASEVAFWENAEDLWIGLANSIPTEGAEVYIESTANGVGNFFHQMWEDAETGASGYLAIFLPWWIHEEYELHDEAKCQEVLDTLTTWEEDAHTNGIEWEGETHKITLEKLAWRRQLIRDNFRGDERSFRQEYPSTAREAFLVSGNIFFDEQSLTQYETTTKPPLFRANLVWAGGVIIPSRSERGYLRVWQKPRQEGHYVIWADTASGKQVSERETVSEAQSERGGRDFCSADVFDRNTMSYVAQLHGRIVPEVFAEQLQLLGYFFASGRPGTHNQRIPSLIAVERNHSSGETVLSTLKEQLKYPRLYYHKQINRRTNTNTEVLGWVTNVENRQVMLDDFAQALRENAVDLPNEDTIRECFTFVRGDDGKPVGQEGCHDDRVMSAAGVLRLARYSFLPTGQQIEEQKFSDSPAGFWEG